MSRLGDRRHGAGDPQQSGLCSSPIAHRSSLPRSADAVRAFLAVDLAADVHAALIQLKRELAAQVPSVRWVRDEGLHATIKFLGNIASAQIDPLRQALVPVVSRVEAFTVRAHALGAFPSPTRPRVIWVGLLGDALSGLTDPVERALEPQGFARERRSLHCHITLGRIDAPQAWARVADALKSHASDDFGSSRITEVVAYRSLLQRGGAVYTRLWTIELADREGGFHGAGCES